MRVQGLSRQQEADFVLCALEAEAKSQLQLNNQRDKDTGQEGLDILKRLDATTKEQLRACFFNCKQWTDYINISRASDMGFLSAPPAIGPNSRLNVV